MGHSGQVGDDTLLQHTLDNVVHVDPALLEGGQVSASARRAGVNHGGYQA